MKRLARFLAWFVPVLCLALVACAEQMPSTTPTRDELGQLVDAQTQATIAAAKMQSLQRAATTQADATRQYLILQGQQTRIAQDAAATATTFAGNGTATRQAVHATQTMSAAHATTTQVAAQFTATAHAQNIAATATANAANAQATQASASATATANAVIVEATRASASATAIARAADARATTASAVATATTSAEMARTFAEKQEWERRTETARAIGTLIAVVLAAIGGVAVVGIVFVRFSDSFNLRVRTIRDADGTPFVVLPQDRQGRQAVLAPTRQPGGVALLTPPGAAPLQIAQGAVDPDVTKRAQAIQLARAFADGGNVDAGNVDELSAAANDAPARLPMVAAKMFVSKPLDLTTQPTRLALPVGVVADNSDFWIPLPSFTHALVAGSSGMGKTRFLHGWIQALIASRSVELVLVDGKGGVEYARYATLPGTQYVEDADVADALANVLDEVGARNGLLRQSGATNLQEHNQIARANMRRIVIIVDEIAGLSGAAMSTVITLAQTARASGVHLICATQHPDTKTIPQQVQANAVLRVAMSVPSAVNSVAILGCGGAQKLGGLIGRMLVSYAGKLTEAQAYTIELPSPGVKELGDGGAPKPTALIGTGVGPDDLPDEIRAMVKIAVEQGGGMFVVTRIAAALGIRPDRVTKAAQWLEQRGLLTVVQKDDGGQNAGRHISPALAGMV